MVKCKRCGKEYQVGIKGLCSEECFRKDVQERIDEATRNEKSHTTKFSKDES